MRPITVDQTVYVLQKQAGWGDFLKFTRETHENQGRLFNTLEDLIKSQVKDDIRRVFPKTTESYRGLKNALAELKYEVGLSNTPPQPTSKWTYTSLDDRIKAAESQLKDLIF